ncbi:MAG: tyrosine-type recombinase/integrase [Candidatus Colwellbacteria bacterium]|nr:tyrosine-type recombinase/integrase [Candidatus Colwellbacteria bacterium]
MDAKKPIPRHLNDFLEYCEVEKGLSPTTTKNYARFLNKFFNWLKNSSSTKNIYPNELTEEHVWKYRLWLSRLPNSVKKTSPGLASSTQTRYLIALRALFAYFHEKNIPSLPTEKIKLPKERKEKQVVFLSIEQVEKLLKSPDIKTVPGLRDRAILETLFSAGLRVAELVSLNREHLEGAEDKNDFEISIMGKGRYPRTIYFSERALLAVKEYLFRRTEDDDHALFIRTKGPHSAPLRLTTRAVETIVQKYAKKGGLSVLATPHTLRHSFATDLLNQGADLRSVQELPGHRNIATTQVYTHVTNKKLREVHRKFHGGRMIQ